MSILQATSRQRPIYLNGQPLGQTYRRLHDGDRRCDDKVVKRILAPQLEDSRATHIQELHGLADLDLDTLLASRNAFAVQHPGHSSPRPASASAIRGDAPVPSRAAPATAATARCTACSC